MNQLAIVKDHLWATTALEKQYLGGIWSQYLWNYAAEVWLLETCLYICYTKLCEANVVTSTTVIRP